MGLATQMMKEVADLIRLGFPESTATKIASGELPMDTASGLNESALPAGSTALMASLLAAPEEAEAGFVTRGGRELLEAWHGSPHEFDRFSMDAIGTGEGAQVYGHGLYFADVEDVATGYRDALTQPRIEVDGKTVDSPYTSDILNTFSDEVAEETRRQAESWAELFELQADSVGRLMDRDILDAWVEAVVSGKDRDFPADLSKRMADLEDDIGMSANDVYDIKERVEDAFSMIGGNLSQVDTLDNIGYVGDNLPDWAKSTYDRYFDGRMVEVSPKGALYRTEIDVTPDQLLDWDRPLSEQGEAARQTYDSIMRSPAKNAEDRDLLDKLFEGLEPDFPDVKPLSFDEKYSDTGAGFYSYLEREYGPQKASEILRENGFGGIKYLDGNSRNRPMRDVKAQFLNELPEDAEIDDVIELLDGDTFSPENKTLLQSLAADDWLGFDYPSQSLSAVLGDNLSNYDASPELTEVIRAIRDKPENTSNYVIFDDKLINIAERGAATPGMMALLAAGGAGATAAGSESNAVTEATSRIVNHMLDNVTEVTDLLEIPQRGIQGLLRAGYGLMQGDGLDASLNAGADVVNQGVEETAKQAGDAMLEKTGNPELATMAYTAVMLGSPL